MGYPPRVSTDYSAIIGIAGGLKKNRLPVTSGWNSVENFSTLLHNLYKRYRFVSHLYSPLAGGRDLRFHVRKLVRQYKNKRTPDFMPSRRQFRRRWLWWPLVAVLLVAGAALLHTAWPWNFCSVRK